MRSGGVLAPKGIGGFKQITHLLIALNLQIVLFKIIDQMVAERFVCSLECTGLHPIKPYRAIWGGSLRSSRGEYVHCVYGINSVYWMTLGYASEFSTGNIQFAVQIGVSR